jgi:hypothetical protein
VTLFDNGPSPNVPRDMAKSADESDLVGKFVDQRNRDLIKVESAGACLEEANGTPIRM